jgi:hypothetical protein
MQYECMMSYKMSVLYVPHQKKRGVKYIWCTHSRWQTALILMVSSSGMTYANVISILAKNTIDIYDIHHHLPLK